MAEPLELLLNAALVAQAASHVARVAPDFDAEAFTAAATAGLDRLELKARALQIADAVEARLPADFDTAACDRGRAGARARPRGMGRVARRCGWPGRVDPVAGR